MKSGLSILLLLFVFISCPAQDRDPNLLFSAGFDGFSTVADVAGGNPKSVNWPNQDLNLRMWSGIKNQGNALMMDNSEYCAWELKNNFNIPQGTVSLWVSPQNWKPGQNHFQHFFTADAEKVKFLVYKYSEEGKLLFLLVYYDANGARKSEDAAVFLKDDEWQWGHWYKLDAVWDRTGMKLYINGVLRSEKNFAAPIDLPQLQKGSIQLGAIRGWGLIQKTDKNAFDNLQIYNRRLSADEIRNEFEKYYTSNFGVDEAKPLCSIPRGGRAPVIDGKLEQGEWADAALLPIFKVSHGSINHLQVANADVRVKYDADNLYVGFRSNIPPAKAVLHEADGNLWEDDAFELHLLSPGGDAYQFILNANGAIYDSKGGLKSYNTGAVAAAAKDGQGWSVEMAVPLAKLGNPKTGEVWKGNFCFTNFADRVNCNSWSRVGGEGMYSDVTGFGTIRWGDGNFVQLRGLENLESGRPAIQLATSPGDKTRAEILFEDGTSREFKSIDELGKQELGQGKYGLRLAVESGKTAIFSYEHFFRVKYLLEADYDVYHRRRLIQCKLEYTGGNFVPGTGTVALMRNNLAVAETEFKFDKKSITADLVFPENPESGEYTLKIKAPALKCERELSFVVPDMTPYQNRVAVNHQVPPPWNDVKVTGKTVQVLDRSYTFDAGPFPVSAVSRGNELLAAAPALTVNGKAVRWNGVEFGENHGDYVELSGNGSANGIRFGWKGELWFDGMYKLDWSMTPEAGKVQVKSLKLDWKTPRDQARYVMNPLFLPWKGDTISYRYGMDRYFTTASNVVWTTGLETGFSWFCASDANWSGKPEITLTRGANDVRVDIPIIAQPVELSREAAYSMAFMATPGKRPPADRHNIREGGWGKLKNQNLQTIGWASHAKILSPDDTYPWTSFLPRDVNAYRQALKNWQAKGITALAYSMPTHLAIIEPEYKYFYKTWSCTGAFSWSGETKPEGQKYLNSPCCDPEAADLFIYRAEKMLDALPDLGGLYHDICVVEVCSNREHGCAGTDAFGKDFTTSNGFHLRDYLLRLYKIHKERGKLVMLHGHNRFLPMVQGLGDIWWPGEEHSPLLVNNPDYFYAENVSREEYQAAFNAEIKGMSIMIIYQHNRSAQFNAELRKRAKELDSPEFAIRAIAPSLLHGIVVDLGCINRETVDKLWGINIDIKLEKGKFHGYWYDESARSSTPDVYASYYTWDDAAAPYKSMVVAVNLSRETRPAGLILDPKRFNPAPGTKYKELWSGRELSADELKSTPIEGNHFLLIGIR